MEKKKDKKKASILWRSAFFMVQLSHPYMTAGKTIVLTRQASVSKVMSLLFNMLSRLFVRATLLHNLCGQKCRIYIKRSSSELAENYHTWNKTSKN